MPTRRWYITNGLSERLVPTDVPIVQVSLLGSWCEGKTAVAEKYEVANVM